MEQTNVLIVGASIAGLAAASSLQKKGIAYIIIEKERQAATPWRNHYDRLHLHTIKGLSNLPFKKFGSAIPRYPSRQQVVDYLEDYSKGFNIGPVFNTEAKSIKKEGDYWMTETSNGIFKSNYIIMATGAFGKPKPIDFKGMDTFPGQILHSCKYKTGHVFKGQHILVVGFGNSACEIAIDLFEQGAIPAMSVRSPVNIIPRDILGIPIIRLSLLLSNFPTKVADAITAPIIRLLIGDITKLGLKKMTYGPLQQIEQDGNAPVIDIGTLKHIRKKHIKVYGNIDHIAGNKVFFVNGREEEFDNIIAAIGYDRNVAEIVDVDKKRFDDLKTSVDNQKYFGKDGLYFCGFWIAPTGQIREIALDAQKIAKDIAAKENTILNKK